MAMNINNEITIYGMMSSRVFMWPVMHTYNDDILNVVSSWSSDRGITTHMETKHNIQAEKQGKVQYNF